MEFESWTSTNWDEQLICTLQISGMNLDPETFLTSSGIPKERVLLKGTLEIPNVDRDQGKNLKIPKAHGLDANDLFRLFDRQNLLICLSDAPDISKQITDATDFLRRYRKVLNEFLARPEIDDSILKFNSAPDESQKRFRDLTPELHELIAECKIRAVGVV